MSVVTRLSFVYCRTEPVVGWTEDSIKLCLYLYLGLLPIKHNLIHELANVYTAASADIKRTILRILETPVRVFNLLLIVFISNTILCIYK